jgi:plastocyanin
MNQTLFYIFGIALVVSAVGVAGIGLRFESFPPNRGALAAAILYFAVLVGGTAVFAVLNARDEQHKREAEQAAATQSTSTATSSTGATTSSTTAAGGGATVKLAADPSQIAFATDSLQAPAGSFTIDFDNPNAAIPHDVCVQDPSGGQVGCSDQVIGGTATLALKNLKPGSYTFYCSVDSHEQAGMKGTLTVK